MDNSLIVHIFQANYAAGNKKLRFFFCELFADIMVVPQVSTRDKICNQVQIFIILECIEHIYQKRVFELAKQFSFVHYRVNTFFIDDPAFRHFFHRV